MWCLRPSAWKDSPQPEIWLPRNRVPDNHLSSQAMPEAIVFIGTHSFLDGRATRSWLPKPKKGEPSSPHFGMTQALETRRCT